MGTPFIGEIRLFAGNFAPAGWAFCAGQAMPIAENDALFFLLGTTYGGDGETTFNLPDLRGRAPLHLGTGGDGINYLIGEQGGVESVTLTVQQIPTHTHVLTVSGDVGGQANPSDQVVVGANPTIQLFRPGTTAPQTFDPTAVSPIGGNQPHENRQPFLAVNYIISLFGIFP